MLELGRSFTNQATPYTRQNFRNFTKLLKFLLCSWTCFIHQTNHKKKLFCSTIKLFLHNKNLNLKLWCNSKSQIVMTLKNSNCHDTQELELWWNSKTQIVMKLKLKLWWNSKTQIVMKLKNLNCDQTQIVTKLKLWQNSNCDKTHIVTKLKNLKYYKTHSVKEAQKLKLW